MEEGHLEPSLVRQLRFSSSNVSITLNLRALTDHSYYWMTQILCTFHKIIYRIMALLFLHWIKPSDITIQENKFGYLLWTEAPVGKEGSRTWSQHWKRIKLYCLTEAEGWYVGLLPIFLLTSGAVTKLLWGQIMNENSLLYYKRSNTPPKTVLTYFF